MFTPIAIAKFAATTGVQFVATRMTTTAAVNNFGANADALSVQIGAAVVGWQVSEITRPYTDRIVEKTASTYAAMRSKIATK